jgi:Domain of unknown function (DUF4440)
MHNMIRRLYRRPPIVGATAAAVCALALSPVAGYAAGTTQTLRFFDVPESTTLTQADGTVVSRPPLPEPKAGDVLDVYSVEYAGNHRHHASRSTASVHQHCAFSTAAEPDCEVHVALGGSLLVFRGDTLTNGTGRYQRATGRVLTNQEVAGGSDIVAKIRLRAGARAAAVPARDRGAEADRLRAIEATRVQAMVGADIATARSLMADDFQAINPAGVALSREQLLGAVQAGAVDFLAQEPTSPIAVRLSGDSATLRYQKRFDLLFSGIRLTHGAWVTELYERRQGRWQLVWEQTTAIPNALDLFVESIKPIG